MILPQIRDPRFITIRRGGTMTDDDHRLSTLWAAECTEHVLRFFEDICPNDNRPCLAIAAAHALINGEIKMTQAKGAKGAKGTAQYAVREVKAVSEAARMAALSAGQAAVVPHVAEHELGAGARRYAFEK